MNNEDWCKENCPYSTDCSCDGVCNFVLSLLKKHEPVPYKRFVCKEHGQVIMCGNCEAWLIVQHQTYCHECGQAVKWE